MAFSSRRAALCNQPLPAPLTGIDFVRIADTSTQRVLHVFFVVDPSVTESAPGSGVAWGTPGTLLDLAEARVSIEGADPGYRSLPVTVATAEWISDVASGRTVLEVTVDAPGDFSNYVLTITHDAVDRFFRTVRFSFKQACPSDFDCRNRLDCDAQEPENVLVDYAARDFDSFRSAVLDFTARRYPEWQERIPADGGVMLAEVLCALADEFSYMQDRMARESHFATATQRRSVHHMARLVDYDIDQGASATTLLTLVIGGGGGINVAPALRAGDRLEFWALTESPEPVPFEVLPPGDPDPDVGDDHFWLHPQWNEMRVHAADPAVPCLPKGATSLLIAPMANGLSPLSGTLDPSSARPESENWEGRTLILRMDPDDPSRPHHAWPVTPLEVSIFNDPLVEAQLGAPFELTEIRWGHEQALPFELSLPDTRVYANNLPAVAGRTVVKHVRTGDELTDEQLKLDLAVIRESARYEDALAETVSPRRFNRRVGLEETVHGGLAFSPKGPLVKVEQVDGLSPAATVLAEWSYSESLLDADEDAEVFTIESGLWTEIRRFETAGKVLRHSDYAHNGGFSVLFGDGLFGANPAEDIVLRLSYRLNPGRRGNVPSRVISALAEPGSKHAALGGKYPAIIACTNLLPAAGGRDPETVDHIRRFAPQVYRARPLRAVVDEDFQQILGRLSFVQTVGVKQRWTGSWLTRFLTADPLDENSLSDERERVLLAAGDSVRLVGRHVTVVDPVYRPVDLAVTVCVTADAYFGQVKQAVIEALVGGGVAARLPGLFHPDNFSFGTPLLRSSIEAAVQRVPGVLGVERICIRARGDSGWREFAEGAFEVGVREIIQVRNDPRFPDQGTIAVRQHQHSQQIAGCAP